MTYFEQYLKNKTKCHPCWRNRGFPPRSARPALEVLARRGGFNIKGFPVVIQKLLGTSQRGQGPSGDSEGCTVLPTQFPFLPPANTPLVPSRSPALWGSEGAGPCWQLSAEQRSAAQNMDVQANPGRTFLWRLGKYAQGARCLQGRAGCPVQGRSSVLGLSETSGTKPAPSPRWWGLLTGQEPSAGLRWWKLGQVVTTSGPCSSIF